MIDYNWIVKDFINGDYIQRQNGEKIKPCWDGCHAR